MNVVVNDAHLYNIADAIRAKAGTEEKYTIDEMSSAIDGLSIQGTVFEVTGDCTKKFYNHNTGVFPIYGDYINWNCHDITDAYCMFYKVTDMEKIPFDLHFSKDGYIDMTSAFEHCQRLKVAPVFANQCHTNRNAQYMFRNCHHLREIPEGSIKLDNNKPVNLAQIFASCYSLRSFPMSLFEPLNREVPSGQNVHINGVTVDYSYAFSGCMALDELVDLPLPYVPMSTVYNGNGGLSFGRCYRLARLKFRDDGRYRFTKCTIDLSAIGYYEGSGEADYFLNDKNGNSGITSDKLVINSDTYNKLKNDPDWYTNHEAYSRYDKNSAIETIASLPDMKAIQTSYGGTHTIKFNGKSGLYKECGAIETMTEEEIAVATAKGWTISYV